MKSMPSHSGKLPQGSRDNRKHTAKVKLDGLYQKAVKEAFVKLDPRIVVKNPVMFVVWLGTIVTLLVTLEPNLFGTVQADVNQQRLLNGIITLILFFYSCFCEFCRGSCRRTWKSSSRFTAIDAIGYFCFKSFSRWYNSESKFYCTTAG